MRNWKMRGRAVANCHMFTDGINLDELHAFAQSIGLKKEWFQNSDAAPHYDLTDNRRKLAVANGACEVDFRTAAGIWKARRLAVAANQE